MNTTGQPYGTSVTYHVGSEPSEPIDVMEIGNAVIWGGKRVFMDRDLSWNLRLRFQDQYGWHSPKYITLQADSKARKMLPTSVTESFQPPTIDIDWPDFGAPSLNAKWWRDLVDAIKVMPDPMEIAVYCEGGHGRTGTALAILASLSGASGDQDPVHWVRTNYHEDAVESKIQIAYVQAMTGKHITAPPSDEIKSIFSAERWEWERDENNVWRKREVKGTETTATSQVIDAHIQSKTIAAHLGLTTKGSDGKWKVFKGKKGKK